MRLFRWHSAGPIPLGSDLRRLGWQLLEASDACGEDLSHPLLVRPDGLIFSAWLKLAGATPTERKWIIMVDVADPQERVRLLRLGFGDAIGPDTGLDELEQRVLRASERAQSLPRYRHHGALRMDLLAREAFVAGRALGLHPREFALLWRLADNPARPVTAEDLLGDVWRLRFRPETNSLAVHVSRLRAKLRLSGLNDAIETTADGGYRLNWSAQPAVPLHDEKLPLDAHLRLREEREHQTLGASHDGTSAA